MVLLQLKNLMTGWGTTIFFILTALVIILAYIFIKRYKDEVAPKKRLEKNDHDKSIKALKKIINKYIKRNDGRVIYMTEVGSKKTKGSADVILIGYFGVLVIVGCDLSGDLYANDKDKIMTQIVKGERRNHNNPILESQAAAKAVMELLREKKIYKVPVESSVVFTAKKVGVNVPRSLNGYTKKEFKKVIKSKRYLEDKGVNTDAVAEVLLGLKK